MLICGQKLKTHIHGTIDKPAVIFLHGFLGSGNDWLDICQSLKNDFYCVLVDLPGHGKSAEIKASFNAFPQQLQQTLDGLSIQQFYLVGYSLGGRLALAFIDFLKQSNQLERLNGLLIESSHYGLMEAQQKQNRLLHDQNWAKKIVDQSMEDFLSQWYQQPVFADLPDALRNKIRLKREKNQSQKALAQALTGFSLGLQNDYSSLFIHLTCPVIYLHGARDKKFSGLAKDLKKTIHIEKSQTNKQSAIEIRSIADCGHNVHLENPQALIDAVYDLHNQLK